MPQNMDPLRYLMLAPLLLLLMWAALIDLRSRRIPNWLTFSLAAAGLLQSFLPGGFITPLQASLGLLTGFALNIGLFAINVRGGGDVKLFAALGAWVGPLITFEVFIVSILVAALGALVQAFVAGKIGALFSNTALLAVSLAHPKELGVAHVTRPDGSFRSIGRPVPYAVPVIIATVLVLAIL
jgi:prepilin peptidase CpaA